MNHNDKIYTFKEISETAPKFSEYKLYPYFKHIGTLTPNQDKEKLELNVDEPVYKTTPGLVYAFVVDGYLFKLGKTEQTITKRVQSYNCGKKKYRSNGTCSTTNYMVLQSFLSMNKPIEVYGYYTPPIYFECFGEKVKATEAPSKYIERVCLNTAKEQFGKRLIGVVQSQENTMFEYFDELNKDLTHYNSTNDICTPMGCVKEMVDAIPDELWSRPQIKVLDPSAGNGNFPAYISTKTNPSNITANEINPKRLANMRSYFGEKINITSIDFLKYPNEKFDLIITNPPFAKFMEDGKRAAKNHSLSREFVKKAIELVNEDGYLVFVLPDNWMSYADRNTLPQILTQMRILTLNIGEAKHWFPKVGSSFTWFVIQNRPNDGTPTQIIMPNQCETAIIDKGVPCIPLKYNEIVRSLFNKVVFNENEKYKVETTSDLHRTTKKTLLSAEPDDVFKYEVIHTPNQTLWASRPHKWQEGWKVFLPTTTYYNPFIKNNVGLTQSITCIRCENEDEANRVCSELSEKVYKVIIDLTRYGNFNNQRVLQHLSLRKTFTLTDEETAFINQYKCAGRQ